MDLDRQTAMLKKVPLFSELEASKLKLMGFVSDCVSFDDAQELCHIGEVADCVYVILDGRVDVFTASDDGETLIATLGEHQLVGELSVLRNTPRMATVRAKGKTEAARIASELFVKFLSDNSREALEVMRQLSEKLALAYKNIEVLQGELRPHQQTPER
jgi:CRP-like cAMP-binding protein